MRYFMYETVAKEAEISKKNLDEICKAVRQEFPHDDMMYELHVLRVCTAIKSGYISIEEAIRPDQAA